jgi:hypothetical protein
LTKCVNEGLCQRIRQKLGDGILGLASAEIVGGNESGIIVRLVNPSHVQRWSRNEKILLVATEKIDAHSSQSSRRPKESSER